MSNKSNFSVFLTSEYKLKTSRNHQINWDSFVKTIDEVQKAESEVFLESEPRYSFICLRVALEKIFEQVHSDTEASLFDSVKKLSKNWPNCWVLSGMHQIRVAGNEVAHSSATNKTHQNLIILLEKFHDVLRWFLEDFLNVFNVNEIPIFECETYIINCVKQESFIKSIDIKSATYSEGAEGNTINDDDKESEILEEIPSRIIALTEKQKELSNTLTGKHFVNAPPGTGKTHLLVERLCNASKNFLPEEIVCLTFTNRAAKEMETRVAKTISNADFFIGNIHAFCMSFLRSQTSSNEQRKFRNLSLLDDEFTKIIKQDVITSFFNLSSFQFVLRERISDKYRDVSKSDLTSRTEDLINRGVTALVSTSDKRRSQSTHSILDEIVTNEVISQELSSLFNIVGINNLFRDCLIHEFKSLTKNEVTRKQELVIQKLITTPEAFKELDLHLNRIDSQAAISHCLYREAGSAGLLRDLADEQWARFKNRRAGSVASDLEYTSNLTDDDIFELETMYLDLLKSRKELTRSYDFDDLIAYGLIHIAKSERKYISIQVDECQDLNVFQWAIIELLTAEESNVMAFGDMAQSIYGFMGASSELLSEYTETFEQHNLDMNYRSNKKIVELLNHYRERNLPTDNLPSFPSKDSPPEPSTLLLSYPDEDHEAIGVTSAVRKIVNSKNSYGEDRNVGILLRGNKEVDLYATHLNENNIKAFRLSQSDIMRHTCIVDFMSLLRVYSGRSNRIDWYKLFYRLTRDSEQKLTRLDSVKIVDSLFSIGVSPLSCLSPTNELMSGYAAKKFVSSYECGRIVVFDTETTSADVAEAELLQLAAVAIKDGIIVDKFNQFIRIDPALENNEKFIQDLKSSSEIHHIDIEKLKEKGRSSHKVFNDFLEFLGGDDTVLVAHNAPYDIAVLERNFDEYGDKKQGHLEKFLKKSRGRVFDTLSISRTLYPTLESYKLESLLAEFDLQGVNSHDALDDVIATASLVTKIYSDLSIETPKIDEVLKENYMSFLRFNSSMNELLEMLTSQSINFSANRANKNQLRISDILAQWIEYVSSKKTWYDKERFTKLSADIESKLVPWIERHLSVGRLSELVTSNDAERLSMMSEADLIDLEFDKVIVSTVHRAKGLQFETTIIPRTVDGTYPSYYSVRDRNQKGIEEDARLLYVALSRPTDKLIVTYYKRFKGYKKSASRFIKNIEDCFDYVR